MRLTPETTEELLALTVSLRAHLEAEDELGAFGLPLAATPPRSAGVESPARAAGAAAVPAPPSSGPETPPRSAERAATPPQDFAAAIAAPAVVAESAAAQTAALAPEERRRVLQLMAEEAAACTACVLHEKRNRSVFGRGSADSEIVFVGEGPGRDEDQQGLPFVGAAGQLLDRMIAAMGYGREDVYICNVVKCRPPDNRTPRPEEMIACSKFLVPQLETIRPKVIVALGRCAAQALGVAEVTGPWRGRWGAWRGIPTLPTYHPAFLLRSPEFKRTVWEDLQLVMGRLGRTPARR
jgi:uracil-DNA glycosylase family 4